MRFTFYKYQGTGNDFIILDNRSMTFERDNHELVRQFCDRRFGIGADGLMLLQSHNGFSFEMVYYNSDGNESSMCGNGGRCITAFAKSRGLFETNASFLAVDGPHEAIIGETVGGSVMVKLKMNDVSHVENNGDYIFLDTGSPHYVRFEKKAAEVDVYNEGRKIRYSDTFGEKGTNVNFVERTETGLFVRTYERGVEDETYSCGTGVTAAVLGAFATGKLKETSCRVSTLGGELTVYFTPDKGGFTNIWLEGPVTCVYNGEINV